MYTRSMFLAKIRKISQFFLMHESFATTASPPTGHSGNNDFSEPWYRPQPYEDKLMVTTLLITPPNLTENPTLVKIQMLTPWHFPCTVGTIKKELPCSLAPPSPPYPVGGAVVANGWCIKEELFLRAMREDIHVYTF